MVDLVIGCGGPNVSSGHILSVQRHDGAIRKRSRLDFVKRLASFHGSQ